MSDKGCTKRRKQTMSLFTMTKHACHRSQQRSISSSQLTTLFSLADMAIPVDRHLTAFRVSRMALSEAIADGMLPAEADRLARRTMVLSDDGAVVTVAHLHGTKARSYSRRDRRPYWKATK
jgi:hypothetical protein